ncbi:MAG: hypothetical protein SFX18_14905 [Pirellulales bacterium]|nr:hypothetical protein [Pirellulales bacterium]
MPRFFRWDSYRWSVLLAGWGICCAPGTGIINQRASAQETASAQPPTATTPPPAPSAKFAYLIAQLGSNDFLARELAQRQLLRQGAAIYEHLLAAARNRDPEISQRALAIAQQIFQREISRLKPEKAQSLILDYFATEPHQRAGQMQAIARNHVELAVPVLATIVRFEQSPAQSKLAALNIWQRRPSVRWNVAQRNELIQSLLAECDRPAAKWLLTLAADPGTSTEKLPQLRSFLAVEQSLAKSQPHLEQQQIVRLLLKNIAGYLLDDGRQTAAGEFLAELLAQDARQPQLLLEDLSWILDRQASGLVPDLDQRIEREIAGSRVELLYLLAEAAQRRREPAVADQYISQIDSQYAGQDVPHYAVALFLQKRGLRHWAEREFVRVVADPRLAKGSQGFVARHQLAEIMAADGRYEKAVELIKQAQKIVRVNEEVQERFADASRLSSQALAAKEHLLLGLAAHKNQQPEVFRKELLLAIRSNANDADSLIELYKISRQHQDLLLPEVEKRIKTYLETLQERIDDDPDFADPYNEYAWLVGNTVGDLDLAIKYSLQSLEIEGDRGGYFDTLAHCYFAKREFNRAVEYQQLAAELDPDSPEIRAALARFETALTEAGK